MGSREIAPDAKALYKAADGSGTMSEENKIMCAVNSPDFVCKQQKMRASVALAHMRYVYDML